MTILPNELSLVEMLDDPMVRTMMWRDGVEPSFVAALFEKIRQERFQPPESAAA